MGVAGDALFRRGELVALDVDRSELRVDVVADGLPLETSALEPTAVRKVDRIGDGALNLDVLTLPERVRLRGGAE